ncbi:MAG TPA: 2-dehydro-3-deoxy-6-phosphogalactonate aldolase [Burkholderiaceae bacterium]
MNYPEFDAAFDALPLVAILRGVTPPEVEDVAAALYEEGFRLIEVPLNSPDALDSIARLAQSLPADAVVGAGTVMSRFDVTAVKDTGARLIVMPHADTDVISYAKENGMVCIPGAATPTEVFAALAAGAEAVKIFPAELVPPAVLKAMRAVVARDIRLLPVGGITPERMDDYRKAGASGFGLGSALYAPGMAAEAVRERARQFVAAW